MNYDQVSSLKYGDLIAIRLNGVERNVRFARREHKDGKETNDARVFSKDGELTLPCECIVRKAR